MFLEFLSHMIKHTSLRFLYGILYVLGGGGEGGGQTDLLC